MFCSKNLKQENGETYYSEAIKITTEDGKEEIFCSFECLDKYQNKQKQAKNSTQNNGSSDKKWIIFPILGVVVVVLGSLIYIWLKRKKK